MLKLIAKAALGCAVIAGIAQADIIHQTTKWQSLGRETIADGIATNSNNGVSWSLDEVNWTQLTDVNEFSVNQTVYFKVEVWKEYQGTHLSDVAKVWIDNVAVKDGYKEWALADNGNTRKYWGGDISYFDGTVLGYGTPKKLEDDLYFNYTFTEAKEYELIARTMCSDDLSKLNQNDGNPTKKIGYLNSWGYYYEKYANDPTQADRDAFTASNPSTTLQGEIERYTFKVNNVPEPSLLSLLGFGLLGIAFIRRKK